MVKLVPVIVTIVPTTPLEGVNEETVGIRIIVKLEELLPVPPGVIIEMGPVVAPVGTVTVICVAEFTVKVVALIPLNLTAVAPVKPVPVITTGEPNAPDEGVNDEIVGGGIKVKLEELVAVPPGVVTEMVPVLAPTGTVAEI